MISLSTIVSFAFCSLDFPFYDSSSRPFHDHKDILLNAFWRVVKWISLETIRGNSSDREMKTIFISSPKNIRKFSLNRKTNHCWMVEKMKIVQGERRKSLVLKLMLSWTPLKYFLALKLTIKVVKAWNMRCTLVNLKRCKAINICMKEVEWKFRAQVREEVNILIKLKRCNFSTTFSCSFYHRQEEHETSFEL